MPLLVLLKLINVKAVIQIVLWVVILFIGYMIYNSIQEPIEFEKIKKERFMPVIKKLEDIRISEIAYKDVNGEYTDSFDSLIKFIDQGRFVLTESRDTSYLDEEYKKVYGTDKYIPDVIIDTIGYASVKDSLFRNTDRYKEMMYVPGTDKKEKFELDAGFIIANDNQLPVFEAKVDKAVILKDQNKNLIELDKKKQSVDDINGEYIRVGAMDRINDSGNWPKDYGKKSE